MTRIREIRIDLWSSSTTAARSSVGSCRREAKSPDKIISNPEQNKKTPLTIIGFEASHEKSKTSLLTSIKITVKEVYVHFFVVVERVWYNFGKKKRIAASGKKQGPVSRNEIVGCFV